MKIKGFPNDSRIDSIGNLFRWHGKSDWFINVFFCADNTSDKNFTKFSNATMLAKKRSINPTQSTTQKKGFHLKFRIDSTKNWHNTLTDTIGKPIKKPIYHHFSLIAKWIDNKDCKVKQDIHIQLPQFELARALFFHNAYLARSALDSGCIDREFDIQDKEKSFLVNILPSSSFPLNQFNNAGTRRILAWILIDKDVRESYKSIAKQMLLYGQNSEKYHHWSFSFEPPELKNVEFEATGYYDQKKSKFYVNEIISIQKLSSSICKPVEFFHEKFQQLAEGNQGNTSSSIKQTGTEPTINDTEDGTDNAAAIIIETPQTLFDFINPVITHRTTDKPGRKSASGNNDIEESTNHTGVSTGEPNSNGTIPSGEFEGVEDQSDDTELYLDKFNGFKQMIDHFSTKQKIIATFKLHKLPALVRCSKHIKDDGNPRCIAEVRFIFQQKQFIILEVDTSDNLKPLSTQVLCLNTLDSWSKDFKDIQKLIIKHSLQWPSKRFISKIAINNWQLNHPRSDKRNQKISGDIIREWANRLINLIN